MGRREKKREATRREILRAATELFESRGFEATSVDDIVESADVARGTFYYHFDSKEALVFSLQESTLRHAAEEARKRIADSEPPLSILLGLLSETARWTEANPELAKIIVTHRSNEFAQKVMPPASGKSVQDNSEMATVIAELLGQAQARNEIRSDVSVGEILLTMIPVLFTARATWLIRPEGSLVDRLERSMKLLLEGLSPAKS